MIRHRTHPRGSGQRPGPSGRRPTRAGRPLLRWMPAVESLEARCVLSVTIPIAATAIELPTDPTTKLSGSIAEVAGHDMYRVTTDVDGLLSVSVHATGCDTLLSLLDDRGRVLMQSEATSPTNLDDRIDQHLSAGTYHLDVAARAGAGSYDLSTRFTAATTPYQVLSQGSGAFSLATADFNGDHIPDMIVPDYYGNQLFVNLGLGDGTFRPPTELPVGGGASQVVAVDLNGDGFVDLAVADQVTDDISILLGNGDGTFRDPLTLATRSGPVSLTSGDFNNDGIPDLAVAEPAAGVVDLFRGVGDGHFLAPLPVGLLGQPNDVKAADFNGDGHLDLAVASVEEGGVILLRGLGNGTFVTEQHLPVGPWCSGVVAGDLNGDGRPDLAAVSRDDNSMTVFINQGAGNFLPSTKLATGKSPYNLVAADLNGDGRLDLAVCNATENNLSMFLGAGDGRFQPAVPVTSGSGPMALVVADFNNDGRQDLAVANYNDLTVTLLMNNGDATFHAPASRPPSSGPESAVTADLNGDGIVDLLIPQSGGNDVAALLGRGDGTFLDPIRTPTGLGPDDVTVGDYNGDGIPDIAVVNYVSNDVSIFKGRGDGRFDLVETLATGSAPSYVKTADLDGDGHLDFVVANYLTDDVSVFYGRGDGTFHEQARAAAGRGPSGVVVRDFNGDGILDLAVSNSGSDAVSILLGSGARTFQKPSSFAAGANPWTVASGDFNGDGHPDLVVADEGPGTPSYAAILMGVGDGTFRAPSLQPVGDYPYPITVADFNHDGHLDVLVGNDASNDLSLLQGRGDGTFAPEVRIASGLQPYGLAVADYNGDGILDVASANIQSNDVTVNLGRGDGTFQVPRAIPLVGARTKSVVADFDGDGRLDVAIAEPDAGTIAILLGQGDGTFRGESKIGLGGRPEGLLTADFNGDGRPDLAVTDGQSGDLVILLGLGDGTFRAPLRFPVSRSPDSIVAADFNGDGRLDIAATDTASNEVTLMYGLGDGTFRRGPSFAVGAEPVAIVAIDLNRDGRTDLVTANRTAGDLTFLVNAGGGAFLSSTWRGATIAPSDLVVGDFDGNGIADLVVADQAGNRVLLLMGQPGGGFDSPQAVDVGAGTIDLAAAELDGSSDRIDDLIVSNADSHEMFVFRDWGAGSFASSHRISLADRPGGLVLGDFNEDGRSDVIIADAASGVNQILLGRGDGDFYSPQSTVPLPHAAPLVLDVNYDGTPDVMTIDRTGQILLRFGRPGTPGEFDPPLVVTAGSGNTARDLALLRAPQGIITASLDWRRPLLILARPKPGGVDLWSITLPAGGIYSRLIAGDLNRDGLDDLVVLDRASNQVLVFIQETNGQFHQAGEPTRVGFGPTDATLTDLNHDGWLDLIVTNGSSGDVSILPGGPGGRFGTEVRLRGGLDPAVALPLEEGLTRSSQDEPVGVISGVFDPSGLTDVVVVQRGSDRISVLKGTAGGGLADPSRATSYTTGVSPTQVVAAALGRNGLLDLAVLNEGSRDISVFMNDGRGGFLTLPRVDAGDSPTGLAVRDVNGDGLSDLLVGDQNGDLLILLGNGDGSFQPYQRADRTVTLASADLNGDGLPDFVLSNEGQDLLSVQSSQGTGSFSLDRASGLRAPGPVAIADMNGDGIPDLMVTNRGGNDVFVYLGTGAGRFAPPQRFYTGTAPEGLTRADLNGDGLPDLVVTNSGSNDVTILLGQRDAAGWTMVPGPRLHAGIRPVSTTVADVNGDGINDILCVNQDSNSVTLLLGLGGGFFNDREARTFPAGLAPIQAFVGRFGAADDPGLVVLNSLSNDMTYYSTLSTVSVSPRTIGAGGLNPVAGVMGDFNHDGFSDLVVANNGDAHISLFYGGVAGPILSQTVALPVSTHPTDLIVASDAGSRLHVYISAEGEGNVVPISFTVAQSSFVPQIVVGIGGGFAPTDLGRITSPVLATASGASNESLGLVVSLIGEFAITTTPQAQIAVASSGQLGAVGSGGTAALVALLVSQAAQPLLGSSLHSLTWLIENLVSLGQASTSEILPLGKGDMAIVAVILSVSSTSSRNTDDAADLGPGATDEQAADRGPALSRAEELDGDGDPVSSPSALALFLCRPDRGIDAPPSIADTFSATPVGLESEWVWRQDGAGDAGTPGQVRDGWATPVDPPVSSEPDRRAAAGADDAEVGTRSVPDGIDVRGEPLDAPAETGTFSFSIGRAAATLITALLATAVVVVRRWARRAWPGRRAEVRRLRSSPRRTPPPWPPAGPHRGGRRSRPNDELPPWLAGRIEQSGPGDPR